MKSVNELRHGEKLLIDSIVDDTVIFIGLVYSDWGYCVSREKKSYQSASLVQTLDDYGLLEGDYIIYIDDEYCYKGGNSADFEFMAQTDML